MLTPVSASIWTLEKIFLREIPVLETDRPIFFKLTLSNSLPEKQSRQSISQAFHKNRWEKSKTFTCITRMAFQLGKF